MRPPTKDSNAKDKIETEEKSDVEEKEDEEFIVVLVVLVTTAHSLRLLLLR